LRDDEKFYKEAASLFNEVFLGKKRILMLHSVLAEVVYVLKKFYKIGNEEIKEVLTEFLKMKGIKIHDKDVIFKALQIFENKNLDFMDCILCAYSEDHVIISFDEKVNNCIKKL